MKGDLIIKKIITIVEENSREMGLSVSPPSKKACAIAVIANPYTKEFSDNLELLFDAGQVLGKILGEKAVAALDSKSKGVQGYGKAAIVGINGEIEHAAAVLHPKFGAAFRSTVGGGKAIIPSTKKVASAGSSIDIPLFHKDAAFVVSHIDSLEIRVPDAPKPDEILVAAIVSDSGRPLARSGGLIVEEIIGEDGLR